MTSLDAVSTPAPAGTLDRARVSRLIGSGIWLVFLGNPLGALLRHDDRAERYLGLAAMAVFVLVYLDRKSTRLNSSHSGESRMPSSA